MGRIQKHEKTEPASVRFRTKSYMELRSRGRRTGPGGGRCALLAADLASILMLPAFINLLLPIISA
jgi:hypothetical protein